MSSVSNVNSYARYLVCNARQNISDGGWGQGGNVPYLWKLAGTLERVIIVFMPFLPPPPFSPWYSTTILFISSLRLSDVKSFLHRTVSLRNGRPEYRCWQLSSWLVKQLKILHIIKNFPHWRCRICVYKHLEECTLQAYVSGETSTNLCCALAALAIVAIHFL